MSRLLCGVALLVCFSAPSVSRADPTADTKAALVGYASNIAAVTRHRVTYRTTHAEAASAADALAGKWVNAAFVDSLYIRDGDSELFSRDAGKAQIPKLAGKGREFITSTFVTEAYLSGEPGAMSYFPAMRSLNLIRPQDPNFGRTIATPLTMGTGPRNRHGPDRLEQDTARFETTYLGKRELDGLQLVGVRSKLRQSGELFEFWLDPARGYLPARIYGTLIDGRVSEQHLMEARDCGRGRWFPTQWIDVTPRLKSAAVHVEELKVIELDTERKPAPEEFVLPVPGGTQVLWQHNSSSYRLKQDETLYAKDLPEFFAMSAAVFEKPLADTGLTRKPKRDWYLWSGIGVGTVLVLGGVIALRRRSRGEGA